MKNYFRVMLGKGSIYAGECLAGHFIGADYGIAQDLTHDLPDEWQAFNKKFIPIFLDAHPDKTKIGAGLALGPALARFSLDVSIPERRCRRLPQGSWPTIQLSCVSKECPGTKTWRAKSSSIMS